MKEFEELNSFEKTVLLASCDANNFSLHSHVPIEAIKRRVQNMPSKLFNNAFKTLKSSGFVVEHKTRGGKTYGISKKGLMSGNKLKKP